MSCDRTEVSNLGRGGEPRVGGSFLRVRPPPIDGDLVGIPRQTKLIVTSLLGVALNKVTLNSIDSIISNTDGGRPARITFRASQNADRLLGVKRLDEGLGGVGLGGQIGVCGVGRAARARVEDRIPTVAVLFFVRTRDNDAVGAGVDTTMNPASAGAVGSVTEGTDLVRPPTAEDS